MLWSENVPSLTSGVSPSSLQIIRRLVAIRTPPIEQFQPWKVQTLFWMDRIPSRKDLIVKCAVAAIRKGYSMFAVQNGGWCASSSTAPQTFDKYAKSAACKADGEGGPWANQVYVIKGNLKHATRF